jgi:hypothetical protein
MAKPPSTASPASWNPAVPPPPVTGAAGYEVYAGLGDGLGDGLGVGLWSPLADALADALAEALAEALADGLGELLGLAELLAEALTDDEPLALGDNTVTGGEPLPVQAESATQTSTVMRPQPTVSLTRCAVHAMAVRALIGPPHALGNHHFPVADRRNRRPKGNV